MMPPFAIKTGRHTERGNKTTMKTMQWKKNAHLISKAMKHFKLVFPHCKIGCPFACGRLTRQNIARAFGGAPIQFARIETHTQRERHTRRGR